MTIPILPDRSTPSQRLINEAALIVYGRWRAMGLSHDDALDHATFFARRVVRIAERSNTSHTRRHQPYPVRAAIDAAVASAMVLEMEGVPA
jgi:hypothetical protein